MNAAPTGPRRPPATPSVRQMKTVFSAISVRHGFSTTDPGPTKGFDWAPGDGSTWAFEIDCRMNANFFDGHNMQHVDSDWIYSVDLYKSAYYQAALTLRS